MHKGQYQGVREGLTREKRLIFIQLLYVAENNKEMKVRHAVEVSQLNIDNLGTAGQGGTRYAMPETPRWNDLVSKTPIQSL